MATLHKLAKILALVGISDFTLGKEKIFGNKNLRFELDEFLSHTPEEKPHYHSISDAIEGFKDRQSTIHEEKDHTNKHSTTNNKFGAYGYDSKNFVLQQTDGSSTSKNIPPNAEGNTTPAKTDNDSTSSHLHGVAAKESSSQGNGICGKYDNICPETQGNQCQDISQNEYACASGPNYCSCRVSDEKTHSCECTGSTAYCEVNCAGNDCTVSGCILSPISGFLIPKIDLDAGESPCMNADNPCPHGDDSATCRDLTDGGWKCECNNWFHLLNTTSQAWSCVPDSVNQDAST